MTRYKDAWVAMDKDGSKLAGEYGGTVYVGKESRIGAAVCKTYFFTDELRNRPRKYHIFLVIYGKIKIKNTQNNFQIKVEITFNNI